MGNIVVTPPATEPVTLAEAKAHLRVSGSAEDTLITALIVAARQHVETTTCRSLITQTRRQEWSGFPASRCPLRLPFGPVISITSFTYVDSAGDTQTLTSSEYIADLVADVPTLRPLVDEPWPDYEYRPASLKVVYEAGYGAASAVPQTIKQAMFLLIGHWYAMREAVVVGGAATEIPLAANALLADHCIPLLA